MKLADQKAIEKIQSRIITKPEFNYDTLFVRPLASLLTQYDVDKLYNIATSVRYAGNADKKFKAIDDIMHSRGFIKISAGTNRICYGFLDDPTICVKVAEDKTGIKDNPREFMNQLHLKPFCTKVFEVTPCGTVGLFERVRPIKSREEFISVADQIFELIDVITSKYILADFGSKYFMNYGFRENFGPVILDFPYLYETDTAHLVCKKPIMMPDGHAEMCGGLIDYDKGFNNLVCTKCGAVYRAVEISKYVHDNLLLQKGNGKEMDTIKLNITKGGKVYKNYTEDLNTATDHIKPVSNVKFGNTLIVTANKVPVKKKASKPQQQQAPKKNNITPVANKTKKQQNNKSVEKKEVPVVVKKKTVNIDLSTVDTSFLGSTPASVLEVVVNKKPVPVVSETASANVVADVAPVEVNTDEEVWNPDHLDLENKVIIYKNNLGKKMVMPIPDSLYENISAADELEEANAKADKYFKELKSAKDSVTKTINQVKKLEDELTAFKTISMTSSSNDTKVIEDLENQLQHARTKIEEDKEAATEVVNNLQKQLDESKSEYNELKENYDQMAEDFDSIEKKLQDANKEIADLKQMLEQANSVETASDYNEAESDEDSEEDDLSAEETRIYPINGTWCPLSKVEDNYPNLNLEGRDENDRVIVFEDGNGGLFSDQYGNIIVIASINNIPLADKELTFKKTEKEEK